MSKSSMKDLREVLLEKTDEVQRLKADIEKYVITIVLIVELVLYLLDQYLIPARIVSMLFPDLTVV